MQNCLVTGATGFVGGALIEALGERGVSVKAATRRSGGGRSLSPGVIPVEIGPVGPDSCWRAALGSVDTVFHLAARVHVMKDKASDPLTEFRAVNTLGTETLARQAAAAGVCRFVYVSSIKVNGEGGRSGAAITEADAMQPQDPYGVSKAEAELALHQVARETGMEIVILRPPLVYGPHVRGNFFAMLETLRRRTFLPLATVGNRRSLLYVGNLVDALILAAEHPAAAGMTYLLSDGEDVSTPQLLRILGDAMGVPARLWPMPVPLLKIGARMVGKAEAADRLVSSLVVDSSKIRCELGWVPPFTLSEGLRKTADWFNN